MRVWVNGTEVGMTKCSKTPAEFDVTKLVHLDGRANQMAVQVYRWHDGSYMEDRDFWRITGIERDVYLQAYSPVSVWDYNITATPVDNYRNGQLETDVTIRNFSGKSVSDKVLVQLRDASGKLVLNETKPFQADGKETTVLAFRPPGPILVCVSEVKIKQFKKLIKGKLGNQAFIFQNDLIGSRFHRLGDGAGRIDAIAMLLQRVETGTDQSVKHIGDQIPLI